MENNEETNKASDATDNLLNGIFGDKPVAATPTDVEKEGLKGKVKQVKQLYYKAFEKEGRVYLSNQEVNSYDKKNIRITFDEKGTKRQYAELYPSFDRTVYNYNEDGVETDITSYNLPEVVSFSIINKVDEEGNIIEQISYDQNNKITSKTVNVYETKGLPGNVKRYGEDGELQGDTEIMYNANGQRTEIKSFDKTGKLHHWNKYNYNEKDQMIENITLDEEGKVKEVTSLEGCYDEEGNFSWDNRYGRKKKEEDLYTNKIEVDEHDNWIKKIICYRNIAIFVYIRDIEYFDEPAKPSITIANSFFDLPLNIAAITTEQASGADIEKLNIEEKGTPTELNTKDAKWLGDKSPVIEGFPLIPYYLLTYKEYPSQVFYHHHDVDVLALMEELKTDMNAAVVNSYETYSDNNGETLVRYTLSFPKSPGYMLHAVNISTQDADSYEVPDFIHEHHNHGFDGVVHVSQLILLKPSDASGKRDEYGFEEDFRNCIEKCTIKRVPSKPHIYMVEVTAQGTFGLQSHPAKDNFEILDLDIQYGYGFSKFHHSLMARFRNENQGLVLFHGLPGTGKTYYIRHLLREMAISNKIIIYMPPNMVDHLVEPSFMTFLSNTVSDYSADDQFCVLLIEDAEPLLATRETSGRIQGITNLLNMTDGLLNDMLKLQIICTFNVDLKELDAALLRPGRLIARKEFKALQELDANLLAQRLGIKHHFSAPATLSEIYALLKNKGTLIHDDY